MLKTGPTGGTSFSLLITFTHLVAKALLASAKGAKVFGRLGDNIGAKLKFDTAHILSADLHVEKDCKSEIK